MTQTPYTASVPDDAPIQVRSHRRAQWFWLDNALIDTHAQAIGPIAVALYVGLCRYANAKTGQCWPSLVRLSQQLGMTRLTARRYLQVLVAHRLIQVEARPGTTTLVTILEMPDGELPAPSGGEEDGQAVTRGGYDVTRGWLPGDHEPDLLNQTQEPDPPNPPEEAYAPREKKPLDQPAPLPPLSDRPDDALGALGLDVETRTQLYDRARAALVAEGVSPWQPHPAGHRVPHAGDLGGTDPDAGGVPGPTARACPWRDQGAGRGKRVAPGEGRMKDHTLSQIIAQLQAAAEQSSDLLHKNYRDTDRSEFVLNGLCYPLAEALSHLCPGLFTSWRIPWEDGSTHWFLRDQAGAVLDLVSHPGPLLCAPEDYAAATRARFLSHTPSRRARTLLERAGLTLPTPAHRTKGRHP